MTYLDLIRDAERQLDDGQISLGEYENMIEPLKQEIHTERKKRWIPCSERLPEPGEYYLVTKQYFGWNCKEYREIDIAKYDFDGWYIAVTVLAWCELPKPYREEGEK